MLSFMQGEYLQVALILFFSVEIQVSLFRDLKVHVDSAAVGLVEASQFGCGAH